MPKYKLTLTFEADSPEALLKALEFYKKDLGKLTAALEHITDTREAIGPYSNIGPLAGKLGQLKYTVESFGLQQEKTAGPVTLPLGPGIPAADMLREMARIDRTAVAGLDRPEGCQAEGTGGGCGGENKCDMTGVCATKGKADG